MDTINNLVMDSQNIGWVNNIKERNNPCESCVNNPKNNPFSAGFCCCALPSLLSPIY